MEQEYRHIFVDETSNRRLSNSVIQSGVGAVGESGSEIATGSQIATGAGNQLKQELAKKFISQPLNQMTGGLYNPAKQLIGNILSGAGTGAIAGAVTAVAFKGVELIIDAIQKRIEKLENEARAANDNDNALIRAGKLNITDAKISTGAYGRAIYKFDRS